MLLAKYYAFIWIFVLCSFGIAIQDVYCVSQMDNMEYDGSCGKLLVPLTSGVTIHVPWVATVHVQTNWNSHVEAAAIITPTLVIMNANRFSVEGELQFFKFSNYHVSGNLTSYYDLHDNNTNVQTVEIMHIRIHPAFSIVPWEFVQGDLAIIHLKTPLVFDKNVHSICIPTQEIVQRILSKSSDPATQKSTRVFFSGWGVVSLSQTNLTFLNVQVNNGTTCKKWWKQEDETKNAPYDGRFCGNVTEDNPYNQCIHRDNGVVGESIGQYYFLGFMNNYFSHNHICDSLTRIFVCQTTFSLAKFINDNIRCGPQKFTCDSGRCVDLNRFCDGVQDCTEDGSDETNIVCKYLLRDSKITICSQFEFRCGLFGKCIAATEVCDGKKDYPDGEDENNCKCTCSSKQNCGVAVAVTLAAVAVLIRWMLCCLQNCRTSKEFIPEYIRKSL